MRCMTTPATLNCLKLLSPDRKTLVSVELTEHSYYHFKLCLATVDDVIMNVVNLLLLTCSLVFYCMYIVPGNEAKSR